MEKPDGSRSGGLSALAEQRCRRAEGVERLEQGPEDKPRRECFGRAQRHRRGVESVAVPAGVTPREPQPNGWRRCVRTRCGW